MPNPSLKVASTGFTMATGGPATNAAVTYVALCTTPRVISDPKDEVGAASGAPADSEGTSTLLTAPSEGLVSTFLTADLVAVGVCVIDTTAPASSPAPYEPAVSSIIEHLSGHMVASTNMRLDADAEHVAAGLPERVGAVLTDGYNPALVHAVPMLGIPEVNGKDPFTPLEAHPPHLRTLNGGSWKEWLTPLPGFVDIAVVSEDSVPPLAAHPDGAQVAGFLRDFGATRTMRIYGDRIVQYRWDDTNGGIPVETVPDASMLGAGGAFHGVFVWAIERGEDADPERLIRFTSPVIIVPVSPFSTRQRLTSQTPVELVCGWQVAVGGARVARRDPVVAGS